MQQKGSQVQPRDPFSIQTNYVERNRGYLSPQDGLTSLFELMLSLRIELHVGLV